MGECHQLVPLQPPFGDPPDVQERVTAPTVFVIVNELPLGDIAFST